MTELTRNPTRVKDALQRVDGSVVASKECKIYIPRRFQDKNLAIVGNETHILALYMMTVDDKYYSISNVNCMVQVEPSSINEMYIDEELHLELVFEPGDVVIKDEEVIKQEKLMYTIFDAMVAPGRIPVYVNYNDLSAIFNTSKSHTGVKLSSTPTILHMLLSLIARDPNDKTVYFRQVTDGSDVESVSYVSLQNSIYGATNTTSKLMGSHFKDNLSSALVNPSEKSEDIENILRE